LLMAMISSFIVVLISNRQFGGINGDCIGTSNEMGRLIALLTIAIIVKGGMVVWMPW
jgi:adenosylcobinamide-GDP ribazoletransferase